MKKEWHILSLGAGVQSTTLALMMEKGKFHKADCGIFADTGFEPKYVYEHLRWLQKNLSFPVHIVKTTHSQADGNILKHTLKAIKGQAKQYHSAPFYTEKGLVRRQCTGVYKIHPIRLKIREILGLKRYQRCKDQIVHQYIGISKDEMNRMTINRDKYIQNVYPLVDNNITRNDCLRWVKKNNYPVPKKSACLFCPYHDNKTWKDMKQNSPKDFALVVKLDKMIRNPKLNKYPFDKKLYMHQSLKPLDEVDFDKKSKQLEFSFKDECEGMCGV